MLQRLGEVLVGMGVFALSGTLFWVAVASWVSPECSRLCGIKSFLFAAGGLSSFVVAIALMIPVPRGR